MNKTELIDKLLHLGYTTEMCVSTNRYKAKELAHTLIDEYLKLNIPKQINEFEIKHKIARAIAGSQMTKTGVNDATNEIYKTLQDSDDYAGEEL